METASLPSADELRSRTCRLQEHLRRAGIGAALLAQNVDRYYFSGTMQAGFVVVPAAGDPLVLVRRDPERAASESPLPVEALASVRDLPGRIQARWGEVPSPLGLETDVLPWDQVRRLQALFEGVEFRPAGDAVLRTRALKSPFEVAQIRAAGERVAAVLAEVPRWLRPGVRELELSARLEFELRQRGHGGVVRMRGFNQEIFYGHVMGGATAAEVSFLDAPTGGRGLAPALPQGPSARPLHAGEPVVVDLVGSHGGYLSDQTRVFCLGEPSRDLRRVYEAACGVQEAVEAAARPGVPASQLYRVALDAAAATPFGGHFLGERHKVSFVGHGLGLELDEYPFLARGFDLPLEEGMVFALEPKFILEGRAAVGVEDTYLVTATGVERLTTASRDLGVVAGG